MIERPVNFGERGIRQEDLIITADSLIEQNHSSTADKFRADYEQARRNGDLTILERCSDARAKSIGTRSVSAGSIAAARTPDAKLLLDRGSGRGIILTHFDGDTMEPGKMPSGCGGLAAKSNEESIQDTDIATYIKNVVAHKDPFVQSIRAAEQMAYISGKPVSAWAIDHLTDDIYPIAFFQRRPSGSMEKLGGIREYEIADYDPEKIYAEGLPTMDERDLPDDFQRLLEQNRIEQIEILSRYPDFRQMQKVQRPRVILFSTDIRSAKKFPILASIPGSVFKVLTDRQKLGDDINITPESLETAFKQLWYPIHYAVKHHEQTDKSFSNTDRLIIETPSMELSRDIWDKALEKLDVQKWIALPGSRAILLQTNAGRVNDAAEIVR